MSRTSTKRRWASVARACSRAIANAVGAGVEAAARRVRGSGAGSGHGVTCEPLEKRDLLYGDCPGYSYTLPEECECECPCNGGRLNDADPRGQSVSTAGSGKTSNPIRYFDGQPLVQDTDLYSAAFGAAWGVTRSWDPDGLGSEVGNSWTVNQLPQVYFYSPGTTLTVTSSGSEQLWFDWNGSGYTARGFVRDTMTAGTNELILTDSSGNTIYFDDSGVTAPTGRGGQFKKFVDPKGNVTEVTQHDSAGRVTEIRRKDGSGTAKEAWQYTYYSSPHANAGLLSKVEVQHLVGGTFTTYRAVEYTYYTGGGSEHGPSNYLKTVQVKDGSGGVISTDAYRYYTSNDLTNGYVGGLKYVFGTEAYARVTAAGFDPTVDADGDVDDFADNHFQYDGSKRVTTEVAAGAGASGSGGRGTFTYAYADNKNGSYVDDYNHWKYKTVETLPDGSTNTVYANYAGQVILKVFVDGSSSQLSSGLKWGEFFAYDDKGRLVLRAEPSAVDLSTSLSTLETSYDDLLNDQDGNYQYLRDDQGLLELYTYYAQDTFDGSDVGGAAGYQNARFLLHGELHESPSTVTITHSASSTTATVNLTAHGLVTGDTFRISGATTAAFNGTFTVISVVNANSFTYTMATGPGGTNPGGTIKLTRPLLTRSTTYKRHSASSVYVYPVAAETVYGAAAGGDARTTNYSYTWFSGSNRIESTTVLAPAITTTQNGPSTGSNNRDTSIVYFDAYGRPVWTNDGDGFINHYIYDDDTGAVLEQVIDVNTARDINLDGDDSEASGGQTFSGLPTGWSTPAGGGQHLRTTRVVDDFGRTTTLTEPNGNVTHTIYKDADHEVRVYTGWTGAGATGPVLVSRVYLPQSGGETLYYETLTLAHATVTAGLPDGEEPVDAKNIRSLSRQLTNDAGQIVERVDYFSIPTYSRSTAKPGSASNDSSSGNYHSTTYKYDVQGRLNQTEYPTSTIERTVYDAMGRIIGTWVGTDDTSATDYDPSGSGGTATAGGSNTLTDASRTEANDHFNGRSIAILAGTGAGQVRTVSDYDGATGMFTVSSNWSTNPNTTSVYYVFNGPNGTASSGGSSTLTDNTRTEANDHFNGWTIQIIAGTGAGQIRTVSDYDGSGDQFTVSTPWTTNPNSSSKYVVYTGNNMVKTAGYVYDTHTSTARVGDGLLTRMTLHPGGGASERVTEMYYDWRGRLVASKEGVLLSSGSPNPGGEGDNQRTLLAYDYDNLGEVTAAYQYDGDTIGVTATYEEGGTAVGTPTLGSGYATKLRAKTTSSFDAQGRVFRQNVFSVDQSSGSVSSDSLATNYWYGHRGELIKRSDPGGLVSKFAYDGAGRLSASYTSDGGSDSTWAHAGTVTGDKVLTQDEYQYDKNGNVLLLTHRERFHDATDTGALGNPSSGGGTAKARVSYTQYWYDAADRLRGMADVGTNNGTSYSVVSGTADSGTGTTFVDDARTEANGYFTGYLLRVIDNPATTGTASSGGGSTLTDNTRSDANDYFNGWTIRIVAGTGAGQIRTVSDYDGSKDQFTVSSPWTTNPNSTSEYVVYSEAMNRVAVSGFNASTDTATFSPALAESATVKAGAKYVLISPGSLVTDYAYDDAGRLQKVFDPRGVETRYGYDALGRTTQVIEAFVDGVAANGDDRITHYRYDGDDNVLELKAELPSCTFQVTAYVYGVTPGEGSDVASNDLLAEIRYPDKGTGAASASSSDKNLFRYNAIGETKRKADQNGTAHDYLYDVLGRLVTDTATVAGGNPQNVDTAVYYLSYTYDTAGRPEKFTSVNSGYSTVNEVQRTYNGLGQLTAEYQNHSGSVNTSTSPKVQYVYSEMAGSANHSRLTKMIYPDGRTLHYGYNSGLDDAISRLSYISDDGSYVPGQHVEELSYLGLDTVVIRNHPEANSKLTYVKVGGDSNGPQGDQYNGLDRFGRVVDQRWIDGSNGSLDRFQYGYDSNGNVLYKRNAVSSTHSELYSADGPTPDAAYDKLNRLTDFQRGTLSDTVGGDGIYDTVDSKVQTRSLGYTLDALGNWGTLTTNGSGASRTHNSANEITSISGATTPGYDNNGNMTSDETGMKYEYDAWNRLAEVKNSGGTSLKTYAYDARGRRITEDPAATDATELYYSAMWQVLEERVDGEVYAQNIWSPVYVDAMVMRSRFAVGNDATYDSGYGTSGLLETSGSDSLYGHDLILEPGGGSVVVGSAYNSYTGRYDLFAMRVSSSGSPDAPVLIDPDSLDGAEAAYAGIRMGNGGFFLVGERDGSAFYAVLDSSLSLTSWGTLSGSVAYDVTLDTQGRIVVVGVNSGDFFVARFLADGSGLDTSFDSDGYNTYNLGGTDTAKAVGVQSDDRIIVAGTKGSDVAVIRVGTTGTRDTGFNGGSNSGIRVDTLGGSNGVEALVIQPDDKVVVAGTTAGNVLIARYTADGILDATFSGDGYNTLDLGGSDTAKDVTLKGGKLVVVANNGGGNYITTVQTLSLGSLAAGSFYYTGYIGTFFSGGSTAEGVAVQPDGKIVILAQVGSQVGMARWLNLSDERLYVQQDANFNVTGLVDITGTVVERFEEDPYGKTTFLDGDFSTDSGGSDYDWVWLHQGGRRDGVTLDVHFRNRDLDVDLGRWKTPDPIGYIDGLNVYQLTTSNPSSWLDPTGFGQTRKFQPPADDEDGPNEPPPPKKRQPSDYAKKTPEEHYEEICEEQRRRRRDGDNQSIGSTEGSRQAANADIQEEGKKAAETGNGPSPGGPQADNNNPRQRLIQEDIDNLLGNSRPTLGDVVGYIPGLPKPNPLPSPPLVSSGMPVPNPAAGSGSSPRLPSIPDFGNIIQRGCPIPGIMVLPLIPEFFFPDWARPGYDARKPGWT